MSYREWYQAFAHKHAEIMESMKGWSVEEVLEAFEYEQMRRKYPDFCPLYARGEKCHDLEDLNCYLCGCPHFRYCDEGIDTVGGKIRYSLCTINAKEGKLFETEESIHQDCSACPLPHLTGFIKKHFQREWSQIMAECEQCH